MKSKYIISTIAIALSGMVTTSCSDFLDKEVDLTLQADNVFEDYDNTRGFLANLYTYLPDAFYGFADNDTRNASFDCATDNATGYWNGLTHNAIHDDQYNASNHWWANYYYRNRTFGIRACNQFLKNARKDVIGNEEKTGDDNKLGDRWMAEARYIRAILTFDMACWFGATPIFVTAENEPLILNSSDPLPDRTPFPEVMDWVASECDAVKDVLPFRYANEDANWGRINGAAAYALKSRALLYKASPLNNPSNDQALWQAAANAAKDFIDKNKELNNRRYVLFYSEMPNPETNYYDCFTANPVTNNEYILSRSVWTTRNLELFCSPCGFKSTETAVGRTNPTQNLVDCYETKNGLSIDEDPSYDENNPYVNRDPRLEQTVLHHGSLWGDKTQDEERPVDVSAQGVDYGELHGGTATGYYLKKFINKMSFKNPANFRHACPIFRYAEILLNAAEAFNEAGDSKTAENYVNEVRDRVGMPNYSGLSKDKLRERIRNERRIELAFEDHRFFDVRRWMLYDQPGHKTLSEESGLPRWKQVRNIYGILPAGSPNDNGTYTGGYTYRADILHPVLVFNSPKNYYFPIPDNEIKAVKKWAQNKGWELK